MEFSNKNMEREENNFNSHTKELALKIYNMKTPIWIADHIRSL